MWGAHPAASRRSYSDPITAADGGVVQAGDGFGQDVQLDEAGISWGQGFVPLVHRCAVFGENVRRGPGRLYPRVRDSGMRVAYRHARRRGEGAAGRGYCGTVLAVAAVRAEDLMDRLDELGRVVSESRAEQVGALNGWQPQLLNGKREFLVLIGAPGPRWPGRSTR